MSDEAIDGAPYRYQSARRLLVTDRAAATTPDETARARARYLSWCSAIYIVTDRRILAGLSDARTVAGVRAAMKARRAAKSEYRRALGVIYLRFWDSEACKARTDARKRLPKP